MKKVLLGLTTAALIFLSACVTHKQLLIFPEPTGSTQANYPVEDYRVQPNDMLYVSMFSYDREGQTTLYVNRIPQTQQAGVVNPILIYLRSVIVNEKGNIDLPLLGSIYVRNQTMSEIKGFLDKKIAEVSDTVSYFDVKLINNRVSVLGEAKTPGVYYFYETKVTLMQALSQANGLTDFANLKRVKVTRETPNGIVSAYLDLTNPNVVSSEYFFLKSNDIIYIEPLKVKAVRMNAQLLTLSFSAISVGATLTILFLNYTRSNRR